MARFTSDGTTVVLESLDKKEKAKLAGGTKFFVERTGSYGEVLPDRSAHGKLQARMTCTAGGPDHIREISDWHQCGVSPDMKKKAKKVSAAPLVNVSPADAVAAAEAVRAELEAKLASAQAEAGVVPATPEVVTEQQ